ncbi:MAG: DUF5606 domain-containing protein, partial [Tannerella sp.]|nr:DUF5606 domain-containing protein [Tannerella sp.]
MLKTILSVSGRPGLFKLISQGKSLMIIESLVEKKRIPVYARDKAISLGDISVYTNEAEAPLYDVLNHIKAKEESRPVALELVNGTSAELRAYMAEVFPEFDRNRVYPTDIKRILVWYNTLLSVGITEFDPQKKETEKEEAEEIEPKEESKKIPG